MHQFCSNKYAAIQPRISAFGVVPLDFAAALKLSAISRLSLQEITDMFSASHLLRARLWASVGIGGLLSGAAFPHPLRVNRIRRDEVRAARIRDKGVDG